MLISGWVVWINHDGYSWLKYIKDVLIHNAGSYVAAMLIFCTNILADPLDSVDITVSLFIIGTIKDVSFQVCTVSDELG